ncbi:hypothetical protein KY362_00260 [Candidatus Woesearchaeota archaeon]|nr:hypothetical protein [Candidatus Woesearchaeota archaeon]
MSPDNSKNRVFVLEMIIVLGLVIAVSAFALNSFFPTPLVPANDGNVPGIVGFVPVEINNQPLNLEAKEPKSFVLFTDKEEPFQLTSFRLSGTVAGEGRAEIILDNGLGQELVIYSNVKPQRGNLITGMAVSEESENPLPEDIKVNEIPHETAWLRIAEKPDIAAETPTTELDNKRAVAGEFENSCTDTCYMNMNMHDGAYYTLKVRVDPGTEVRITSLKYTLDV